MEISSPEEWRRVVVAPNYWVSNRGRVRHNRKILAAKPSSIHGHRTISITINDKPQNQYIARLVLETFVGPCPPGMYASYLDGNKANVDLKNLAWDQRKPGTRRKLSESEITELIELYKSGTTRTALSTRYDISYWAVSYQLRRAGLAA